VKQLYQSTLLMLLAPYRIALSLILRVLPPRGAPPLVLFGFSPWKTFIQDWFPDRRVIFTSTGMRPLDFHLRWKWLVLADRRAEVLAWQYKAIPLVKEFCRSNNIPFRYVEDGFIRSVKLGALHVPPMSLAFDGQDMYFNANAPTDLETLLSTHDFDTDPALIERARSAMARLLETGISKYNSGASVNVDELYGPKTKARILVIGQVERDASIAYGCDRPFTNNDLVRLAREENPDAQIIYKPHPEVLRGTAPTGSSPDEVRSIAHILEQDISLADSFRTIDHVYTITSLSGFEALLRGIRVTTVGCPFYSGWGLTDDRQPNPRRSRKLTLEQLFAGAYILYPRYFDPEGKRQIQIEDALELLAQVRARTPSLCTARLASLG
jgi:capsular polysaccharide export protein